MSETVKVPVRSGKRHVVRLDFERNLLIVDGIRYGFDYDSKGKSVLLKTAVSSYDELIGRIVAKVRDAFDVDRVLRFCLSNLPLSVLSQMDIALQEDKKNVPVMKLTGEGLVMTSGGDMICVVSDGEQ
jgi:hypothetical protein